MSVVTNTESVAPFVGMDAAFPSESWDSQTARFTSHWGRSGAVIAGHGEIDASNADQLADYVQRCAGYGEWLVLDLTGLDFIGTSGFSALHRINTRCANANAQWALVPSRAVSRLLRVCDPDSMLPSVESLTDALATVQGDPRRLLQLVAQSD